MKKFYSLIAVVVLIACVFTMSVQAKKDFPFTDVKETSWYYDAVKYCYGEGYVTGTSDTTYSPKADVTRAQVVQILANMYEYNQSHYEKDSTFSDVKVGKWYAPCVEWAYKHDVASGTSATTFSPATNVTRQELVNFIRNFATYTGVDTTVKNSNGINAFADSNKVSSWAKDSMNWAIENGIISGSGNMLNPKGTASRAELAVMIKMFAENFFELADEVSVSNAIGSHMILQRNEINSIWGFAENQEEGKIVKVNFNGLNAFGRVTDGKWKATFDETFEYTTKGQTLTVTSGYEDIEFNDILIGDVYYIMGQSNIHYSMVELIVDTKLHGMNVQYDFDNSRNIRFFRSSNAYYIASTGDDRQGSSKLYEDVMENNNPSVRRGSHMLGLPTWETPADIKNDFDNNYPSNPKLSLDGSLVEGFDRTLASCNVFSALGYMTAYDLSNKTDVPVAMIEIDASGCPISTFSPGELCQKWQAEALNPDTGTYFYSQVINGQVVAANTGMATRCAYNQNLYPLTNFACAGIIWYQGESDFMNSRTIYGADYKNSFAYQFTDLMTYFRNTFPNNDFPVYVVEFPSYFNYVLPTGNVRCEVGIIPTLLDNSYVVSSADLFDNDTWANNIHPYVKDPQAKRLTNIILSTKDYADGYKLENLAGPLFDNAVYSSDNKVEITYKYVSGGLKYIDEEEFGVKGFDIFVNGKWISTYDVDEGDYIDGCNVEITADNKVTITYENGVIDGVCYNQKTDSLFFTETTLAGSNNIPAVAFVDYK